MRVAGIRWTIENCLEAAKDEAGLDRDEVRRWTGWYPAYEACASGVAPVDNPAWGQSWWGHSKKSLARCEHIGDSVYWPPLPAAAATWR